LIKPDTTKDISIKIGKAIRNRRVELGYSMETIVKLSGISRGMLALIELGKSNTTITTLWKLSIALKMDINKMIPNSQKQATILTKNSERKIVDFENEKQKIIPIITHNQHIECFEAILSSGNYVRPKWISSSKDYIATLLSGEALLQIDSVWFELKKGDCITFKGEFLEKLKVPQFKTTHFYLTSFREEV